MLDTLSEIVNWLGAILTEIVKGVKGTFIYWNKRKDELEGLVD